MSNESPFSRHRDLVLGYYGTASWLRAVVLALWSGSTNPVSLSRIGGVDERHFNAFLEMLRHYWQFGENDDAFMSLAQEVLARHEEEQRAAARAEAFDRWSTEVRSALKRAGRKDAEDLIERFDGRLEEQFDAGTAATEAAAMLQECAAG